MFDLNFVLRSLSNTFLALIKIRREAKEELFLFQIPNNHMGLKSVTELLSNFRLLLDILMLYNMIPCKHSNFGNKEKPS